MILGILQARMSSSRLPGKVLLPVLGEPMLLRQFERINRASKIDSLIIATSSEETDDPIEQLCRQYGLACFRGSLDDVLDRFYQAAKPLAPDHIVRLTGDCPLADPSLIDQVITFHITSGYDYTSNVIEPTYPDGLDVEVFRYSCLEQAWKEAASPSHREHVTPFLYQQPESFCLGSIRNAEDLSSLRWTVDEREDFEVITKIYEHLYPRNPQFSTSDILALLDHNPALQKINHQFKRNEGFAKSIQQESTDHEI